MESAGPSVRFTSGASAAQLKFIEGVKDLHSFEFDEAAEALFGADSVIGP
jgi:hypothetical protein